MMKPCTAWWLAILLKTLSVCAVPVVFGTALAYFEQGHLLWWLALAALLAAMLIQIGTNLYNDVGDFERGADTAERLTAARNRAGVAVGACRATRRTRGVCAGIADGGGALRGVGRLADFTIGIASLISASVYRWALADRVFTAGRIVCADVFWRGSRGRDVLFTDVFGLKSGVDCRCHVSGSFAAAVITVNNTRDIQTDATVQKRTLAVRLGRSAMNTVYALELLLPFVLLPWFAVQTNLALADGFARDCGRTGRYALSAFSCSARAAFNALLAATAQLQWVFAVLLMGALLFP